MPARSSTRARPVGVVPAPAAPAPDGQAPDGQAPDAQALAEQLRSAVLLLARRLRQQDEMSGLTMSQLSALSVVNARGALTLGELATAERVQPPTMTRLVAALEAQGYLERESDPSDRRLVRVRATDAGRTAIRESRARRTAFLAGRIDGLDTEERAAIAAALPVLLSLQETQP